MCSPQRIKPYSQVIVTREHRLQIVDTRFGAALFFGLEALRSLPELSVVKRCFLGLFHSFA